MLVRSLLVLGLCVLATPARAQLAEGQVWWSMSQHEAVQTFGVGECRSLHAELRERYERSLNTVKSLYEDQGGFSTQPEETRHFAIQTASNIAPPPTQELDELPSGECVAFGTYIEPTGTGLKLYVSLLDERTEFEQKHVRLDN